MIIQNDLTPKMPAMPNISALAPNDEESEKDPLSKATDSAFDLIFKATSEAHQEASAVSKEMTAQMLTGQIDDLAAYMVEQQKPGILFDLNLNMRNKVLDAYQEVMRMQV